MVLTHVSFLATMGRLTSGVPLPTPALGGSSAHRGGALQRCFRGAPADPKPPVTATHRGPYAPNLKRGSGEPECLASAESSGLGAPRSTFPKERYAGEARSSSESRSFFPCPWSHNCSGSAPVAGQWRIRSEPKKNSAVASPPPIP